MQQRSLMPLVEMNEIPLAEANAALVAWGHKMGPLNRPNFSPDWCHGLSIEGSLAALTITSSLIGERAGGDDRLTRETTCELSRLCAVRPGLCRVMLRLWREVVFPSLGFEFAISYQDADLHTGNTYRFDGWQRIAFSHSGTDRRTGRKGRNKWVWVWSPLNAERITEACTKKR